MPKLSVKPFFNGCGFLAKCCRTTERPKPAPVNNYSVFERSEWTDAGRFSGARDPSAERRHPASGSTTSRQYFNPPNAGRKHSSGLRVVKASDPSGCAISCMATVLGLSYDEVRQVALEHSFCPQDGMRFRNVPGVLKAFNVSSTYHRGDFDWDELPRVAIIAIQGNKGLHAVVFERRNNGEYIYDCNKKNPVELRISNYILDKTSYVEIHNPKRSGRPKSHLSIVKPLYGDNGCAVSAIATVGLINYAEARNAAIKYGGFEPGIGMRLSQVQKTLNGLNVKSTYHRRMTNRCFDWNEFPNLAIIAVRVDDSSHAVVFKRRNNKEYIYDCREDAPVRRKPTSYNLEEDAGYIEIQS